MPCVFFAPEFIDQQTTYSTGAPLMVTSTIDEANLVNGKAVNSIRQNVNVAVATCVTLMFFSNACKAECNSESVSSAVTIFDETGQFQNSRMLVDGNYTKVDLNTPGKVSINVGDDPTQVKRIGFWTPIANTSTTFTSVAVTAPALSLGSASNNKGSSGNLIKYTTSASTNSKGGVKSNAYNDLQSQFKPIYVCRIQTGSVITSSRIWIGFAHSDLSSSATPTANCAAFRYDTGASDTVWKCVTANGSSNTVTASSVTVAASTTYDLVVDMSDSSKTVFYINGIAVATVTSTLPVTDTGLGPHMTLTTLTNSARDFSIGTMRLESN